MNSLLWLPQRIGEIQEKIIDSSTYRWVKVVRFVKVYKMGIYSEYYHLNDVVVINVGHIFTHASIKNIK